MTIFPEFFDSALDISIVSRAIDTSALEVELVQLRDFTDDAYQSVDDAPFGGGAGMVMKIEPIARALDTLDGHKVLLAPTGQPLSQPDLDRFATFDHLVLVCGRFEGVDQRVADHLVEEEVSLGDFVLAGGEVAALAIIEGVARLLPGVVGNPESIVHESFRDGLLEEPHYTRPAEFSGWGVPEILLSGDHGKIAEWRQQRRLERTQERRPDLMENRDDSGPNASPGAEPSRSDG